MRNFRPSPKRLFNLTFAFTAPSRRYYSVKSATSFPDPARPDLYYHLLENQSSPAFALSFLPDPPKPFSRTIIGWLPALTNASNHQVGLNDFKENPAFRNILHQALKQGLVEDVDEIQRNGAVQTQQGWMHIHDSRNIPALGRIGDPDDIIASVLVQDGKILPETYEAMPSYRICTSDGLTQLTPGLAQKLRSSLEEQAKRESEID
ncbi:hypothetical protein C8J56DRAFT_426534 [Mycena floridula]|nr:hypothetical protein C8J56DRAFT_426534 [Mycena floridula]